MCLPNLVQPPQIALPPSSPVHSRHAWLHHHHGILSGSQAPRIQNRAVALLPVVSVTGPKSLSSMCFRLHMLAKPCKHGTLSRLEVRWYDRLCVLLLVDL